MSIIKSFKEISWDVPESTYRADKALSYSTLARFAKTGFNELDHLFDKIETPSLTFGSAVDSIITGGEDEFNDRFIVAEFPSISSTLIAIVKALFGKYSTISTTLEAISDKDIIRETEIQGYQLNWRPETRAKVIKEKCSEYYKLLYLAKDKTILDTQTYNDVLKAVRALKESDATKEYFTCNPWKDEEHLYQLKFKATFNNIDFRCMADLIKVDHTNKEVTPIDLKTSGKPEWDFFKSFIEWKYDIQARLYWRIIRYNMDKDPIFKDYTLNDYEFIVVNRKSCAPLSWKFPYTKATDALYVGKNQDIVLQDPVALGEVLNDYLTNKPKYPNGITETAPNNLIDWINNNL
jgi:hypothetical protein